MNKRPFFLGKPFFPLPDETRMNNAGNVTQARASYYQRSSKNLSFLLQKRYEWVNRYLNPTSDKGVELGCGIGIGKDFIKAESFLQTDFSNSEWLDVKNVDAMHTPFLDAEFDFILLFNTLHHLAQPVRFFDEAFRILKPGGLLFIRDVKCSFAMRAILRLMRVEGYSFDVDVYDKNAILSDPENLWEANNAIANLFFEDKQLFHRHIPQFKILHEHIDECLLFFNSGGVTNKTISIPLPLWGLQLLHAIDNMLTSLLPGVFAIQRSLVLQKRYEMR